MCHIQTLKEHLGPETCHLLPFIHAVNGCDTTSKLYGIGKAVPLKKIANQNFKQQATVFYTPGMMQDTIIRAGEKALLCLFNGLVEDSLDTLRYQRFCKKVASCATTLQIQSLPPTSAAAKYHCLRVYFQVQVMT